VETAATPSPPLRAHPASRRPEPPRPVARSLIEGGAQRRLVAELLGSITAVILVSSIRRLAQQFGRCGSVLRRRRHHLGRPPGSASSIARTRRSKSGSTELFVHSWNRSTLGFRKLIGVPPLSNTICHRSTPTRQGNGRTRPLKDLAEHFAHFGKRPRVVAAIVRLQPRPILVVRAGQVDDVNVSGLGTARRAAALKKKKKKQKKKKKKQTICGPCFSSSCCAESVSERCSRSQVAGGEISPSVGRFEFPRDDDSVRARCIAGLRIRSAVVRVRDHSGVRARSANRPPRRSGSRLCRCAAFHGTTFDSERRLPRASRRGKSRTSGPGVEKRRP